MTPCAMTPRRAAAGGPAYIIVPGVPATVLSLGRAAKDTISGCGKRSDTAGMVKSGSAETDRRPRANNAHAGMASCRPRLFTAIRASLEWLLNGILARLDHG